MNPYLAVVSARYRTLLQYRMAAIAGFGTQLFWGGIKVMILTAFFSMNSEEQPITLAQSISYIWLGQALLGMLPWNVDKELESMILSGAVSYELARPLDLYNFWFARTIALRTATTTLRAIPMVAVAMFVFPLVGFEDWAMQLPPDAVSFAVFTLSLMCALILACSITMLMHVAMVWTLSGDGLNRIMPSVTIVFSGMLIPLPLFPDWTQPFLDAQPFRGLVDVPYRIYTGHIDAFAAFPGILHQVFWAFLFIVIGRVILTRSMRRMVIQGG